MLPSVSMLNELRTMTERMKIWKKAEVDSISAFPMVYLAKKNAKRHHARYTVIQGLMDSQTHRCLHF